MRGTRGWGEMEKWMAEAREEVVGVGGVFHRKQTQKEQKAHFMHLIV